MKGLGLNESVFEKRELVFLELSLNEIVCRID